MATITKDLQGDFGAFCNGSTNDTFAFVAAGNWAMANQGADDFKLTIPAATITKFDPNSVEANWLVGPLQNITNVTGSSGKVRLTMADTTGFTDGDVCNVWGLLGTPLGNGLQTIDVVNSTTIDLPAITFISGTKGSICRIISQKGVKNLTLEGNGSTILYTGAVGTSTPNFGLRAMYQDAYHSARTATVAAGSTTITLNDPLLSALFMANTWACMCGFDIQGVWKAPYGFPQNAHFFEYVYITNVDAPTGVITIQTPLRNTYKSTWPNWNTGSYFEIDAGGPATLYSMPACWDTSLTYQNLTIDNQTQQITARARDVTFNNVITVGAHSCIPSMNKTWTATNCDFHAANIEMDKLIETVTFNGSTSKFLKFQSSSTDTLLMDNSNVLSGFSGTPKSAIITNSRIGAGFVGSITGTKLTVTSMLFGEIVAGVNLTGKNVLGSTIIASFDTGSGGTGDYNINQNHSTPVTSRNLYTGLFQPGCFAYGKSTRIRCENCQIGFLDKGGIVDDAVNGKGVNQTWNMVNGVILIPNGARISNVTDNGSNLVRLTVDSATPFANSTGKWAGIDQVSSATLLNGNYILTYIDPTTIDLQDSSFSSLGPYTLDTGVIKNTSQGEDNGTRVMIPGTWLTWVGAKESEAYPFKIIDVTQDANITYVQTSLSGTYPNVPLATGGRLSVTQMPVLATFVNCTGDDELPGYSLYSGERSLFSYANRTYTETDLINAMLNLRLWGYLKKINITVNTAYTGGGTLNLKPFGQSQPNALVPPDYSATSTTQFCTIDLKTSGTRSYVSGAGWTGSAGADVLTDPGVIWFSGLQIPFVSTTFSGTCSVTVEVFTDEGFDLVSLARGHNRWLNR